MKLRISCGCSCQRKHVPEILPQRAIWTTKKGYRVRICDMEAEHLFNAIRCLHRGPFTHPLYHSLILEQERRSL